MSPAVEAALIAGGVGVLTLAGTMFSQFYGIRRTSSNTEKILKQQTEHLDTTLAQQREQLDRTLAQQRDRTLNERSATAADRLGSVSRPSTFVEDSGHAAQNFQIGLPQTDGQRTKIGAPIGGIVRNCAHTCGHGR